MDELRETILDYFLDEFCSDIEIEEEYQRAKADYIKVVQTQPKDIGIAYSQYKDYDEQWTADIVNLKLYLTLNNEEPPAITYTFTSPKEMTDFINSRQAWGKFVRRPHSRGR